MSEILDARFKSAVKALGSAAMTVRAGAGDLFMEIQNPETRETWMCCEPTTAFFRLDAEMRSFRGPVEAWSTTP